MTAYEEWPSITLPGAVEEQFGAPRFPVICDVCETEWSVHIPVMNYAGMLNAYGEKTVAKRFDVLAADPPALRCPLCIFRGAAL